jgi:hypothetical protein
MLLVKAANGDILMHLEGERVVGVEPARPKVLFFSTPHNGESVGIRSRFVDLRPDDERFEASLLLPTDQPRLLGVITNIEDPTQ